MAILMSWDGTLDDESNLRDQLQGSCVLGRKMGSQVVTLIYIRSSNYLLEQHKLCVRRYVASGRDISGGNYVNVKSKTIDEVVFPYGAGDGNRTRMTSLEGWGSTIELRPHNLPASVARPRAPAHQAGRHR
jgi:hypothetical protein